MRAWSMMLPYPHYNIETNERVPYLYVYVLCTYIYIYASPYVVFAHKLGLGHLPIS